MITGKNGIKMSKSKGNVVSPDDLVRDYGCDSLRLYELFVGPPELDAEWDDRGIEGVSRFLNRFWNLVMDNKDKDVEPTKEMLKIRHKLVYDIEQRFEQFSLNTVISGFMEYNNKLIELAKKEGGIDKETLKNLRDAACPVCARTSARSCGRPLGGTDTVFHAEWPECDEEAMKDDEIEIAVQINGKTRGVVSRSGRRGQEGRDRSRQGGHRRQADWPDRERDLRSGKNCEYCDEINIKDVWTSRQEMAGRNRRRRQIRCLRRFFVFRRSALNVYFLCVNLKGKTD